MTKIDREMRIADLRGLWRTQLRALHTYQADMNRYNVAICELQGELLVPPGYACDVLGDGAVKLVAECAKFISEEKTDA